jgi:hypothetical protein
MKSAECYFQDYSFSILCWVDMKYNIFGGGIAYIIHFVLFILLFVKHIIYIAPSMKGMNENEFGR